MSDLDFEEVIAEIKLKALQGESCLVCPAASHTIMSAVRNSEFCFMLNNFDLVVADGMPVYLASKLARRPLPERIRGQDLTAGVLRLAQESELSVYLFGTTEGTLELLSRNLVAKYPGLKIAGAKPSRFRQLTEAEFQQDAQDIIDSNADIVLCGIGSPRQEIWAFEIGGLVSRPICAVGAVFNFEAGTELVAPLFMQKFALEWLFRLCQAPSKLWKRYLVDGPIFLWLVGLQLLGLYKQPAADQPPVTRKLYG